MSLSVNHAINTLQSVQKLGYQGQLTWSLIRLNKSPTEENLKDARVNYRAGASCQITKYLQFWLQDQVFDIHNCGCFLELAYPLPKPAFEKIPISDSWDFELLNPTFWTDLKDGVYYVYLDVKVRCHSFVAILNKDQLIYAGGYGGFEEFRMKTFDRKEWQELFNKAVGPGSDYKNADEEEEPVLGDPKSYAKICCLEDDEEDENINEDAYDLYLQRLIVHRSPNYV